MLKELNINFIVPKKQNENKMKKNKFFLLSILIGISISMKAQNVESYLKSNDLCGFIKACNYDEDLAIKKLYNYQLPDTIQYDKIWYIRHSVDEHISRMDFSVQRWLQPAVSLKQMTYCWMVKIFWKDYDYYSDKEVYFFYYDYHLIEEKDNQQLIYWDTGSYERINDSKREELENILNQWYLEFSNNKNGIRAMRGANRPPFYSKSYLIKRTIDWSELYSDESKESSCLSESDIPFNEREK